MSTATVRNPLDIVLDALRAHHCEPEERSGKWTARCPAHDDENPSLSIAAGDDGKVLVICRSRGCHAKDLVAAIGLTMADLFPSNGKHAGKRKSEDTTIDYDHPVATYLYRNADGLPVYQVRRLNVLDQAGKIIDKTFRQYRVIDITGRKVSVEAGLGKTETVLYRLPELLAADPDRPVWIVEGEKDVDRLGTLNRLATCNPMGALKWRDHYSGVLRGRHCNIIPDNDPPDAKYPEGKGRQHAQQVAQSLHGKAASVKVVELPGLPSEGDVSDFLNAGGTVDQLDELAGKAEPWKGGSVGAFPQVSPISVNLRPVPILDERLLPDPFRSWIKDIAERACCPLDLPSVAALISVASVVGRKVAIRPSVTMIGPSFPIFGEWVCCPQVGSRRTASRNRRNHWPGSSWTPETSTRRP